MVELKMPTMLKAALPVIPGVNLIPGVAKTGGDLPRLTRSHHGVRIDPERVADYAQVCGFETRDRLPFTYPHMLSFPLQMQIMTDSAFPFPAIGTVHLRNTIHQRRPLRAGEVFDVTVTAQHLRPHAKGKVFDLETSITSAGDVVWESTSTYLRLGKGEKDAPAAGAALEVVPGTGLTWRVLADLGRRYGRVSGDMNPIHLYPLTAKALGFKRQIAHGMWTKARCVAALETRLPDEATVTVEFKKPVFLPGSVAFGSRVVDGGLDFSLTHPTNGAPHLVGQARAGGR